jgi:hypothetical protein
VYTKIFSSRLRLFLPDLIHPLQAGFVPGRSIHTPIDTFLVIRKLAGKETKLAKAIGLLLDFAKAYDSLSRPFLLCALRLYGFPQQFVDMVAALHDETSVRFLVNGYLSKSVNVTCGIRQGCPLAPLLFIIAIDILYRVVEASPDLEGVRIIGAELDTTVKISGYADDTALYVTDDSKIPQVISLLDQFGHYSGLRVNLEKSVGVLMSENGATEEVRGFGISILPVDDTCRYLGIQVGTRDAHEANWNGCVDALRVRLALAFAKTHSVIQRAEIARAVIIPKLLYLARHAWPTESTVTELHKFIKSFVWGKINGRTRRAWVSEERAELPCMQVEFRCRMSEPNCLPSAHTQWGSGPTTRPPLSALLVTSYWTRSKFKTNISRLDLTLNYPCKQWALRYGRLAPQSCGMSTRVPTPMKIYVASGHVQRRSCAATTLLSGIVDSWLSTSVN